MKFKQTASEFVVGISWRQWMDDWYVQVHVKNVYLVRLYPKQPQPEVMRSG